jgi:hypothetical protein
MKNIRMFVAVALLFVLASCSLKPMWDIAGKWQQVDGKATIEFLQNGTLKLTSGETTLAAKYMFTDAKRMEVYIDGMGALVLDVESSDKELTITNAQGEVIKYVKAK